MAVTSAPQPMPPQTPFSTAPMPSKHILPSTNTSNPLFNCPHAIRSHFTQCQLITAPVQLPPCHGNTFHPVATPPTPFSTAPMPTKHISHSANTSNSLFNCPHPLKTYFTHCQHLKPPFQLPSCTQNTCHTVPTPQTPFSTAPMPSKHISPSANTSQPLFNCCHAMKTHFTQYQHLQPPFQLPRCRQNTFHTLPTPQTPFSTALMHSKHMSHSANTSNPLFNCPHALQTYFTQCQHITAPFQLPPCHENTFHPVPTPPTPFSTAPMPTKYISHTANTSNPLFNCPHALKTHVTQCQHLKPPFQLPPCPQNIFHPVPTPRTLFATPPCPPNTFHRVPTRQTPFSTAPMPSKHVSHSANTANPPLFNCPHALKTFASKNCPTHAHAKHTQCQHLEPPFQLPSCPQNIFHTPPKPHTPLATAPMPSKHISHSANT